MNFHENQWLVNARFRPYPILKMAYFINKACTKCAACLAECPTGSIVAGKDHYVIDADTCADHADCVAVCPANAIHAWKPPVFQESKDKKIVLEKKK